MEITIELVNEIRNKTNYAYCLIDCRKALRYYNGDKEKAIKFLKKSSPSLIKA